MSTRDFIRTERGRFASGGLLQGVVSEVKRRGHAAVDDIRPCFPDKTRDQVIKAIANAARLGLIERVGLAPKIPGKRAARQGIYALTGREPTQITRPLPPRGQYGHIGKVSSVFDLGAPSLG